MPTYFIGEHQHKGRPYAEALTAAGWTRLNFGGDPELNLALFDHDTDGSRGWRKPLNYLHGLGVPVVIYPHAARPNVTWDGMYEPWPHTKMQIIIAEGHREVLEAYGYPLPMVTCGWAFCELRDFRPVEIRSKPVNVLFAPIHANANGWLHPVHRASNAMTYLRLLQTPGIRLTVRHLKRLDISGLWPEQGVKYVLGETNGKTDEIDQADVVIAHQTYAYLAAARGKPLIMFGDDVTANSGNSMENMRWAKNYDAYRDLMRYPLEMERIHSAQQMRGALELAMSENVGADWRERFIGGQMDGAAFARLMETVLVGETYYA